MIFIIKYAQSSYALSWKPFFRFQQLLTLAHNIIYMKNYSKLDK
jgi:hypothetical protein